MRRQCAVFVGIFLAVMTTFAANRISRQTIPVVSGEMLVFTAVLDSADQDTSYSFNLNKYDHVPWADVSFSLKTFLLYPDSIKVDSADAALEVKSIKQLEKLQTVTLAGTGMPFRYQIKASTSGDSVNVSTYFDGSMDGSNWVPVDSITAITDKAIHIGTLTFGNKKYPYYRLRQADAAHDEPVTVTTRLWLYQDK